MKTQRTLIHKRKKVTDMKTTFFFLLALFPPSSVLAQTNPLDFYPHHVGDVWQYRSLYTGELVGTDYLDSVRVDSLSKDIFIYYRPAGSGGYQYRIDSAYNLYNLNFHSDHPRYKLAADSGDSWIGGVDTLNNGDTLRTYRISVTRVYQSYVFNILTTVKVFRFDAISASLQDTFWIGNDYLAAGFGLVRTDIEPSDSYVLTGAIIDTNHYGTIDGVRDESILPTEYELSQNFPNPFNPTTSIEFYLPHQDNITLEVGNLLGETVRRLASGSQAPGKHIILFDASELSSGVYFYMLKTSKSILVKKMVLLQ